MSINALINDLKENNQDFEFYPTTKEMIETIYKTASGEDWLDIGCGTCNFKKYFEELRSEQQTRYNTKETAFRNSYVKGKGYNYDLQPKDCDRAKHLGKYYVIEKSEILLQKLDKDTIVLGTDFYNTLLMDKPVNNIFCNPPYSEYEQWSEKIIKEANCRYIYLIIPQRWQNSARIKNAIKNSKSTVNILGGFDFLDAERKARAKVDIIKISRNFDRYSDLKNYNETAFDQWFDETFKMRDKKDYNEWDKEEKEKQNIKNKLVSAETGKAKMLVEMYAEEINTLFNHFKAIASLDVDVLETIGVKKEAVKEALKKKAEGAKARYWRIAFDEFEEITSRLTRSTRNDMFNRFAILQKVDFTLENIYPLILWVIKNANEYYNEQLIDFFKKLTCPENVKPYKSNQKAFETEERWGGKRYFKNSEKLSHYTLDYRIIMSSPFRTDWSGNLNGFDYSKGEQLQDIFTIARNLGFDVGLCDLPKYFGEKCTVLYKNSDKVFMEYRAYKNGNMHVKFDIEFTKAMNVEVSRLLGWIRTKEDIKKEFPVQMAKGAEKYFKTNYTCLNTNSIPLLTSKKSDYSANKDELSIIFDKHYTNCLDMILNNIDYLNDIMIDNNLISKCLNILKTQKGFIYRNCLISKQDNKTKVEFREMTDFNNFETLLKAV